ncbi:MAG: tRNA pseudouridine(55) synthase TruB [Desulfuromonadales bacterium]|nr:tRNA pseudouridine(55) synthase TruB [Desulfuromonadales bacterium]
MTSHDVVRQVRRIYHTRKVGHAGTLDPLATGVLLVAIGDGTKILQFLLADNKSYRATFKLGITTDTLDAEGRVLQKRAVTESSRAQLETVCEQFRGATEQVPPMYSALKKNGVPLYKFARRGEVVKREPRQVTISRLEILQIDFPDITIEVDCSKGTYIRSLVADIGEALGCGAHLTALRRLKSGAFSINDCASLEQLQPVNDSTPQLLTLDQALFNYPAVQVDETAAKALTCGVPPRLEQVDIIGHIEVGQVVRLRAAETLAAMACFAPHRLKEKRGDFELIRVFVGQ